MIELESPPSADRLKVRCDLCLTAHLAETDPGRRRPSPVAFPGRDLVAETAKLMRGWLLVRACPSDPTPLHLCPSCRAALGLGGGGSGPATPTARRSSGPR